MNDTLNKYSFTLVTYGGESVALDYRLPPLRRIDRYIDLLMPDKDAERFLFIIGKEDEPEYADQFTDDSIYAALEEVATQMDPRVATWMDRQVAAIERKRGELERLGLVPRNGKESSPTLPSKQVGPLNKS